MRAPLLERDQQARDQVLDEIFTRPFSSTNARDYMLKGMARGLAGDLSAKQGYFIIGPSNSGKGLITMLLECALPGVVAQFDASCLCKETSNDPAKDFGWLAPICHQRIIIANEFNLRGKNGQPQRINGNTWKSVVSGGTDKIECRLLYANSTKVTPMFPPFILANDMPEFDNPGDSGTKTRTVATYMDRHAVSHEPAHPSEFQADPTLKDRICTPEYQNGLLWLLFDYFRRFQQEGHDIPGEVREATAERLPTEGALAVLQDTFAVWDQKTRQEYVGPTNTLDCVSAINAGWGVRSQDVYAALKRGGLSMSRVAVGQQLQRLGVVKHKTRHNGRVFVGLRHPAEDEQFA